ncbi:MAG TPA: hypothetical protein VEF72_03565 [Mycobacterium sp.]|nr:hypothetical protein [Mycobacterium sp.]
MAFGDVGVVECAFGVDAVGAVLLSSSAASGHHHAAIAQWSVCFEAVGNSPVGKHRARNSTRLPGRVT